MKILYGADAYINEPTVIAIGKFDGLHKGHRKIIDRVLLNAKCMDAKSVIYTFNTNPRNVLGGDSVKLLMDNKKKEEELEKLNIDYLVYEDFNIDFANMLPEEFVKNILVDKLSVRCVVIGENSSFGKDRSAGALDMVRFGDKYGFNVEVVKLVKVNGKVLSSTLLRECI